MSNEQFKNDLITVESLLRADIHKTDARVDTLTNKVDTGFEMMSRLFAAAEENMRVMNANMVAMEKRLLGEMTNVRGEVATVRSGMHAMEARLRSEAQASEVRLLAAIQSLR